MNNKGIRHLVIFNLKHPLGSEEVETFLMDGKSILSSIPVTQNFEVFRQISSKNDYQYGFSMEFANQNDYDTYNFHPLHIQFVQDRWVVEVERFMEIDFQE
jgi:hypothetical protein